MNEYCYADLHIGQKESFSVEMTAGMEDLFRQITGDINPLHHDDEFARAAGEGKFTRHVTFGMLTASLLSTLAGVYLPGKYSLIHSVDLKFLQPVQAGDKLTISGEITDKQDALKLIVIKAKIINGCGKAVLKSNMKILVMK